MLLIQLLLLIVRTYPYHAGLRTEFDYKPLSTFHNPTVRDSHRNTIIDLGISLFLVLFAGFASGMTVGLLSFDAIQLKVLKEEGNKQERTNAAKLEAILSNHHLLLVTLLLANSIAMEALPIFLNKLVPEWLAVLLSVSAILLVGEIVPQALCTGRWQVPIVMKCLPVVNFLIYFFFVLSWPIAKMLDRILGNVEPTFYARSHLKALIRLHQKGNRSHEIKDHSNPSVIGDDSALGHDEVVVIEGALDMATKKVREIMVPLKDVYMLEWNTLLTRELRLDILEKGHSRIPIYENHRDNLKGILLVKTLIVYDGGSPPVRVGDFIRSGRPPVFCVPDCQLYDLLNDFQRGRHMAFVTTDPATQAKGWMSSEVDVSDGSQTLLGIVTLEDIIEELLQEEIYDEFDNYTSTVLPTKTTLARSTSMDSGKDYSRVQGVSHMERLLDGVSRSKASSRLFLDSASPSGGNDVTADVVLRSAVGPRTSTSSSQRATRSKVQIMHRLQDLQQKLIEDDKEMSVVKAHRPSEDGWRPSREEWPSLNNKNTIKNLVGLAATKQQKAKFVAISDTHPDA